MKSFCDLSWIEKCKIENGEADILKYQSGYTFSVKSKIQDTKELNEKDKQKRDY